MSHTPRPWKLSVMDDGVCLDVTGPNGEEIVGGCGCCSSPWTANIADAPLLAAAPELLDALKIAVLYVTMKEDWDIAEAAIAKAEGKV